MEYPQKFFDLHERCGGVERIEKVEWIEVADLAGSITSIASPAPVRH